MCVCVCLHSWRRIHASHSLARKRKAGTGGGSVLLRRVIVRFLSFFYRVGFAALGLFRCGSCSSCRQRQRRQFFLSFCPRTPSPLFSPLLPPSSYPPPPLLLKMPSVSILVCVFLCAFPSLFLLLPLSLMIGKDSTRLAGSVLSPPQKCVQQKPAEQVPLPLPSRDSFRRRTTPPNGPPSHNEERGGGGCVALPLSGLRSPRRG